MTSLTAKDLTFKEVEREIFELSCEIGKELMKRMLEQLDQELAENRNKAELRHAGKKKTTIKTLMGEATFRRNIYKRINEDGQTEYIHLLDEALGFETIGVISPNLAEKIIDLSPIVKWPKPFQSLQTKP